MFTVYTDGSAGRNKDQAASASWAYAALGELPTGSCLVHWDRGLVVTDQQDPRWLGFILLIMLLMSAPYLWNLKVLTVLLLVCYICNFLLVVCYFCKCLLRLPKQ